MLLFRKDEEICRNPLLNEHRGDMGFRRDVGQESPIRDGGRGRPKCRPDDARCGIPRSPAHGRRSGLLCRPAGSACSGLAGCAPAGRRNYPYPGPGCGVPHGLGSGARNCRPNGDWSGSRICPPLGPPYGPPYSTGYTPGCPPKSCGEGREVRAKTSHYIGLSVACCGGGAAVSSGRGGESDG